MMLEKSLTFDASKPAWRVRSLKWGPFCYSRRSALWQWIRTNVGLQPSGKSPDYALQVRALGMAVRKYTTLSVKDGTTIVADPSSIRLEWDEKTKSYKPVSP